MGDKELLYQLLVDEYTSDTLRLAGLREVANNLWALDCQTCNRALGTDVPILSVCDISLDYAYAGLHHQRCRRAGWIKMLVVIDGCLSWRARLAVIPANLSLGDDQLAFLLVNPSLEAIRESDIAVVDGMSRTF